MCGGQLQGLLRVLYNRENKNVREIKRDGGGAYTLTSKEKNNP